MKLQHLTLTLLALVGTTTITLAQEPETPIVPTAETTEEVALEEQEVVEEQPQLRELDVKTTIHSSAQEAMDKYNAQTSPKEVYKGYRIRIFASHTQSARTDAEAAIALFKEHFQAPVYFAYENPYFIVTAGNCLTHEEAIVHLSKVKRIFPKAFIITCDIPAEALVRKPEPQPEVVPVAEPAAEPATEPEPAASEVETVVNN